MLDASEFMALLTEDFVHTSFWVFKDITSAAESGARVRGDHRRAHFTHLVAGDTLGAIGATRGRVPRVAVCPRREAQRRLPSMAEAKDGVGSSVGPDAAVCDIRVLARPAAGRHVMGS